MLEERRMAQSGNVLQGLPLGSIERPQPWPPGAPGSPGRGKRCPPLGCAHRAAGCQPSGAQQACGGSIPLHRFPLPSESCLHGAAARSE